MTFCLAPAPPQKPTNLRFTPGGMKNNSVWGVMSWDAPISDLPIKRYSVYWSKRLLGEHTPENKVPLVMQRKTIDAVSQHFGVMLVYQHIRVRRREKVNGKIFCDG
ncbi:WAP-type (Whey Acidic Protein) 'four-disulfide core' [Nesidiocoris tenuis]|uniref:WAP-type (Whey Acidic Protein) 'four-disulfide core n=1 Tax=Nesidiocoris tenuis TaxID=355587 RepID=A0ABN7ALW3_9HEMI|nr:WAP-type (Whey Acidic Protein) 'four-disulfide core' [Nesidiocoris tenuis]